MMALTSILVRVRKRLRQAAGEQGVRAGQPEGAHVAGRKAPNASGVVTKKKFGRIESQSSLRTLVTGTVTFAPPPETQTVAEFDSQALCDQTSTETAPCA